MLDVTCPPSRTSRSAAALSATAGSRSRFALELRVLAEDMAGRTDRDELTRDEEAELADAVEAAVDAVMPLIVDALDDALTPRLESLPLHARLTLVRARDRQELGLG
ncbi:MAG: hypothetical protein ACYC65_02950 [Candidatus Limnocylindrales bacterium]